MIWLVGQMWLSLLAAFALGIAIGWWMRKDDGAGAASPADNADATGTIAVDAASRAPDLLKAAESGPKDELTQIIGLDEATEAKLNALGVFYLRQIAKWDAAGARWIEEALGEPGRVDREHWVEQAHSASS